ncbi:hypothetical protein [Pygmaiobacter massiliensis]|uniref:hypothetical protein n=1 Tax=Pygmaiobacter massiliensis TaxID=1917873 RepID=UPI002A828447|nr:hypothetical protein [Pygmaiobacter massiliensis]MDY4785129.1 hypothetical protein [Pygmaiobacter massiliensis]
MIRGNMWECGFCGDSGFLQADQIPQVTITLTVNQDEAKSEAEERRAVLEPDLKASRAAVKDWDFSDQEWACRDLLVASYPQIKKEWDFEQLKDADVYEILQKVCDTDAKTAIEMWRLLLDTAESHLSDEDAASLLVGEYAEWIRNMPDFTPLLDELEQDSHFAAQVFQSAHVGWEHLEVLTQCVKSGREELYTSLRSLLDENPLPEGQRQFPDEEIDDAVEDVRRRLRRTAHAAPRKAPEAQPVKPTPVDDGRTYRYCQVRFDGVSRAYSYLTDDNAIQPGDWVLAPLGQNDYKRTGKVERVDVYTAANAPYPPERTKHIISKTDVPPEPVAVEKPVAATPAAPEQKPEVIVPPPQPITPPVPEVTPAPLPKEADAPQKSRSKKGWIAAVLLVLLAIGGAYFYLDIQYDGARTNLIAGEFSAAEERFARIPSFFRDQEALSQYAQAGVLAQSDTVADLDQAEAILQGLSNSYNGEFTASITARLEDVTARRDAQLYQQGIDALTSGNETAAKELLSRIPDYQDTPTLSLYATALGLADATQSATLTKALTTLEQIPADYAGPFAEEIAALRAELPQKITGAEAAEQAAAEEAARKAEEAKKAEADRIAALEASGIPYVGMSESKVNSTKQLGKAYRSDLEYEWVKDSQGHYYQDTWQSYAWYQDGSSTPVFVAKCRSGIVFNVVKYGGSTCWDSDKLLVKLGAQKGLTFNYGGGSTDTGAGSGNSLRDDYDSPEDLYEDGGYDDLDEAWDEWEEGW